MVPKLKIESDFHDFYDYLSSSDASVTYKRYTSRNLPRDKVFKQLQRLSVRTVPFGRVRELASSYEKLVVYTDITKHGMEGKVVLNSDEALLLYPGKLASAYLKTMPLTYKVLVIGTNIFRVIIEDNVFPFIRGEVKSIEKARSRYEGIVREPIFSIDYVPTNSGLLAVDFNVIEHLGNLGVQHLITAEEIIEEIYNFLIK